MNLSCLCSIMHPYRITEDQWKVLCKVTTPTASSHDKISKRINYSIIIIMIHTP